MCAHCPHCSGPRPHCSGPRPPGQRPRGNTEHESTLLSRLTAPSPGLHVRRQHGNAILRSAPGSADWTSPLRGEMGRIRPRRRKLEQTLEWRDARETGRFTAHAPRRCVSYGRRADCGTRGLVQPPNDAEHVLCGPR